MPHSLRVLWGVACVCVMLQATSALGGAVALSSPDPFAPVYDLYLADKPVEARELLIKIVDQAIDNTGAISLEASAGPQARMGFASVVEGVMLSFKLELPHGGDKVPAGVVDLSTRTIQAMDRFAKEAMQAAGKDPIIQQQEKLARSRLQQLLYRVVKTLVVVGEPAQVDAYLKQNQAIIKDLGVPVDRMLSGGQPVPLSGIPTPVAVEGRVLAAAATLAQYYDALSRMDPQALQACLTPDSTQAVAILARINRKAKETGEFDSPGPATFDARTTLRITVDPDKPAEFDLAVEEIVKSCRKAGRSFSQRESDHFRFRVVDGECKLVISRGN